MIIELVKEKDRMLRDYGVSMEELGKSNLYSLPGRFPPLKGGGTTRYSSGINQDKNNGEYYNGIVNSPYFVKFHGVRIEVNDLIYTYSPITNLKALFILYGEELASILKLNKNELLKCAEKRNEFNLLDSKLEEIVFSGNAGSCNCDSVSGEDFLYYQLSIMQPPMKLPYNERFRVSCGCAAQTKSNNVQREYQRKIELCKHLVAFMVGLRLGREFLESHGHYVKKIERPEKFPVNNINIITLYSPLEEVNKIFKAVNKEIAELYYIKGKPGREVDYYILSKYGELILSPIIHILLVKNSASYKARQNITYLRGGEPNTKIPLPYARIGDLVITYGPTRRVKISNV